MASPLVYRSPVASDDPARYAPWLLALKNQSGAYIIRARRSHRILYVGESHTGRLYMTITRHLRTWRDAPERVHHTYDRRDIEIAVRPCPPSAAVTVQNKLIDRLAPRDNRNGGLDPDPF
jgi:hypothetical protein